MWPGGLPLGYERFELHASLRSTVGSNQDLAAIFLNGDTVSSNYRRINDGRNGATSNGGLADDSFCGFVPASTSQTNDYAFLTAYIPNPAGAKSKNVHCLNHCRRDGTTMDLMQIGINWESTAAITRIQLRTDNHPTDLFAAGSSMRLIGYRNIPISELLA